MATLLEIDEANRERLKNRDFDKNFLVSASAGTGKTYITVERAFNMLCDEKLGIKPQNVVMITFTRKAATEMKIRLNKRIREAMESAKENDNKKFAFLESLLNSLPEMQISTIHSFCQRVLNAFPLESGIGFAPEFDSEEGGPDGRSKVFFNELWNTGKCPDCVNAGIKREVAMRAFDILNQHSMVQPQFIDTETVEGKEFENKTINACKKLLSQLLAKVKGVKPSIFKYDIANAIRNGENATMGVILSAASKIANKAYDAHNWTERRTAEKAVEVLGALLSKNEANEALEVVERLFAEAKKFKKCERREYIINHLGALPTEYRVCAEFVEEFPEKEFLKNLSDDIKLLLHGIAMKNALKLRDAYYKYRRENHIVNLDDMLSLTAKLIRDCQSVREKLHSQYKVFFVDEYQDTDPVQTDIIFGITAEKYDKDWHNCVPRPGSLFFVGDAKQGIYRFRGADISMWQEAENAIIATNGEVVRLYRNFRSTMKVCSAVKKVFGEQGPLCLRKDAYQAEYGNIMSNRDEPSSVAVFCHEIACGDANEGHDIAAKQIAQFIYESVKSGKNNYEDFLLLSYNREKHMVYADELRKRKIPVKFDGNLPNDAYLPIYLLNLRVQAVCHPFDETLYFRVLCECGNIEPQEWDLFRMTVKDLPEYADSTKHLSIRSLMMNEDELAELLPNSETNSRILKALSMLNNDRELSQRRTPCAFLEEVLENGDGLFVDSYSADEFQNQYSALMQAIDSIRASNPLHFIDMADMLQAYLEKPMDRMPSVRADQNFVRLMNLHKAKGLQGKIVIFLPGNPPKGGAESYIQRNGNISKGWFVIKEYGNYATAYNPPDWEERKNEEEKYLNAEKVRLKYVALTRAEDEAHVFTLRIEVEDKKPRIQNVWEGFEIAGITAPEIIISETKEEKNDLSEKSEKSLKSEWRELECKIPIISKTNIKCVTPSELNEEKPDSETVNDDETAPNKSVEPQKRPCGATWGNMVHRTAELVVTKGVFTPEAVELSAKQAVLEEITSELLSDRERKALLLTQETKTLEQIHGYLIGEICKSLRFMQDENSDFRKMLDGAVCYPEMPFMVSAKPEDKELFDKLFSLVDINNERRIDVSGKIDLALRYSDGTWRILDYKTDSMLISEQGNAQAFQARLEKQYGSQLAIYKIILEYLTGEKVIETKLISVH